MEHKILPLDQLAEKSRQAQHDGKTVVLCHGAFDLLHPGHLRHLQRARQEGDLLLVTITADPFVNKGPGRPVFPDTLRAESVASLACVDYVAINYDWTAIPVIHHVQPSVYAKGNDYSTPEQDLTGNISRERAAVEEHGGRIFFTNEVTYSSTNLINEFFDVFSPQSKSYLQEFKQKHRTQEIITALQALSQMKVLVFGEAIVDKYCYAAPLGLTGKSGNILAVKSLQNELFAGGSLAIANHLAGFVGQVTLLTGLGGGPDNHEPFIRSKLAANVQPNFFYFPQAPTIVKQRFVDPDINKLFEVYCYESHPLTPELDDAFCSWIRRHAGEFDLVVVPDYGNGLISLNMVEALCGHARYLAVNTQINSGNRGYHVITRYRRADFVSLNEPEVRLAAHNRHDSLETVAFRIGEAVQAQHMAITLGTQGALMLEMAKRTVHQVPALSTKVVDRIGAGDAFLSLAGLALGGGMAADVALFVGSAAAALGVQIVCNRESIQPVPLFKYLSTLMK